MILFFSLVKVDLH